MSSSNAGRKPSSVDCSGRPSSKRIKCGDSHDVGHPIEDEATAKRKLRDAGFNPDRISEAARFRNLYVFHFRISTLMTPIIYFSYIGDLPMCRYLYVNGAKDDVTKSCPKGIWYPMKAAAFRGNIAVCKWLYEHGAAKDVYRRSAHAPPSTTVVSTLYLACSQSHAQVCQWLVLKGVLHNKLGGEFDREYAKIVLSSKYECGLGPWARDAAILHEAFRVFLLGTLPVADIDRSATLKLILTRKLQSENSARILLGDTPSSKHSTLLKELLPLRILSGVPGILEKVADFAGVLKSRRERQILRDVAEFFENGSLRPATPSTQLW